MTTLFFSSILFDKDRVSLFTAKFNFFQVRITYWVDFGGTEICTVYILYMYSIHVG
jgi:hypothetical protein